MTATYTYIRLCMRESPRVIQSYTTWNDELNAANGGIDCGAGCR